MASAALHHHAGHEHGAGHDHGHAGHQSQHDLHKAGGPSWRPHPEPSHTHDFTAADLAGVVKHDKYDHLRTLPVIRKLNKGRFDDITIPDIEFLCRTLDENNDGVMQFSEISVLLKQVMVPPCTDEELNLLYQFTDQDESGTVSAAELHGALMAGPLKSHIRALQKEFKIKQKAALAMGRNAPVDRELLHEKVAWRVSRDDAFATLPFSILVITNFILIVTSHLHISQRARVGKGMQNWIRGYGQNLPGPYLENHVGNRAQYWDWLETSGLMSVFGDCPNNANSGLPQCQIASRHLLLADAQLWQTRLDGSQESTWLLHSVLGEAHLAASPGDFLGAVQAQAHHLRITDWTDQRTLSIVLRFSSFVDSEKMFAHNEVRVKFDTSGKVIPQVVVATAMIDPYSDGAYMYALGGFYACLIIYPFYCELKELVASCRNSGIVEGLTDYMSFWNAVDWFSILMGSLNIALWIQCCLAMRAEIIQQLILGDRLLPSVMQLETTTILKAEEAIGNIAKLFFLLHIIMGLNVLTIVLKFFKAFEANARLQLVTKTITRAWTDIVHFMIVFCAVFTAFAVIGHIYFGSELEQFNTFQRSLNTCFIVLMGDFGWYVDICDAGLPLSTGIPLEVMMAWFWSYMVFVLLVLLNMLLAIVLDHYAAVVREMKEGNDFNPVWIQARGYVQRSRETRDFVSLFDVLCQLDDDAHPERRVTSKSLCKAFAGMRNEQAEWIMKWLSNEASIKMREGEDPENITLLKEIEGLIETMSDEQKLIGLETRNVNHKLAGLLDKLKAVRRQQAYGGADQRFTTDGSIASTPLQEPSSPMSPKWQLPLTSQEAGKALVDPVHPAQQMRSQAVLIGDMTEKVMELTSRVDKAVPQPTRTSGEYVRPVPPALAGLMKDIKEIKRKLEEKPRAEAIQDSRREPSKSTWAKKQNSARERYREITPRTTGPDD